MIQHTLNFVLGTAATAGTATAITDINPNKFGTIDELIKYIISIVGGILATIIINIKSISSPLNRIKKQKTQTQIFNTNP
jgi:cytochrome c biogenesis protein CcdA